MSPGRVLTGPVQYSFSLVGSNMAAVARPDLGFGLIAPQIMVGGNPCETVVVVNSSMVRCLNVNATSWVSSSVELVLAG